MRVRWYPAGNRDESQAESQDGITKELFFKSQPTVTVDCASSLCESPSSLYASL